MLRFQEIVFTHGLPFHSQALSIRVMNFPTQSLVSRLPKPRYVPPAAASTFEHHSAGLLYIAGDVGLLTRPSVAIIGARSASLEAMQQARAVSEALASRGLVVLSGLAAGVDAAAHEGALRVGGATIAVIGTPLDRAYPAEHASLQERIYRDHLLVSPFPSGSRTSAWHFPARNRVIARLAVATILVDADEKSGTRHVIEECARERKTIFARHGLIPCLSWLRSASERTSVIEWDSPTDILRHLI
jgi:DNA processing protein